MGGKRWFDVPTFPGYQVNRKGEVRSFRVRLTGKVGSKRTWGIGNKPTMLTATAVRTSNNDIRYCYTLRRDGKGYRLYRAIILLMTFIGPRPAGMFACHSNGNAADDRLSNIRWDTPKNNSGDMVKHGRNKTGEAHPGHMLTEDIVREMRRKQAEGATFSELSREYKYNKSSVADVCRRLLWKHID